MKKRYKAQKNGSRFRITKKKLFIFLSIAVVVTTFILVSTISTGRASLQQRALANVSEARFFMKHAESDTIRVQFFSGIREENYRVDGAPSRTVPFALINVEPKDGSLTTVQELRGTLQLCDQEHEVTLERNQFGRNFGFDLGKAVDCKTEISFTLILANDYRVDFELKCAMPEDAISWQEALHIATEYLADHIKGVSSFETYVKIVTDMANVGAFWFVQFVTSNNTRHFAIITPDGTIIERT